MMEMTLCLSPELQMTIQGSPEECAAFVRALQDPDFATNSTARPAGRTPSRRTQVLRAVELLHRRGRQEASLDEISKAVIELFPDESTRNLDQVVRDLTNKTRQLRRCRWGRFALADMAPSTPATGTEEPSQASV